MDIHITDHDLKQCSPHPGAASPIPASPAPGVWCLTGISQPHLLIANCGHSPLADLSEPITLTSVTCGRNPDIHIHTMHAHTSLKRHQATFKNNFVS